MKLAKIVASLLILFTMVAATSAASGSDAPMISTLPAGAGVVLQAAEADGPANYIIVLADPPLASYRGGLAGLAATNPGVRGERKLDAQSPASQAYIEFLQQRQTAVLETAAKALGRAVDVKFHYVASLNGFALELTPEEAAIVANLRGVRYVERERIFYPTTDVGPGWIGAPGIWDGSNTGGLPGTKGEGVIVGVIDTGIDPWNPSFAATDGDGYVHTNPFGPGVYKGVCDPANTNPPPGTVAYDSTFPCNAKLIGVWGYTDADANPRDTNGHGSHTAGTAAGNVVYDAAIETPTATFTADISGVAPRANIIAYDACQDGGGCPGTALQAARDQALLDGVDIINYSIGGGVTGNPWNDAEAESWLAIRDAGIFVATSAGNAGPGEGTAGAPGDLPWITSVGATSHNRKFLNSLTINDGVHSSETIVGVSLTGPLETPAPVVLSKDMTMGGTVDAEAARLCAAGDPNSPTNPWQAGDLAGLIVVCERGVYGRVQKGEFVKAAGAVGYILAQPEAEGGDENALVADPHVLPAVHITYDGYQTIIAYLNNASPNSVNGTIAGSWRDIDPDYADIMTDFSSRGPNGSLPVADLLLPKVTAPGRDVWAAYAQGSGGDEDFTYGMISGTSMSSPHVAGAGALLAALHPDWTPAEIESALMTTAYEGVLDIDGVTPANPFAQGSGRIDLTKAAEAGLLLNVTTAEYEAADPALGGDPKQLNLASLGSASCNGYCSWTRTLRNPTTKTMSWNAAYAGAGAVAVTPNSFTLAPGASVTIEVTMDVTGLTTNTWHFGKVVLTESGAQAPQAHLTLGVKAQPPKPIIKLEPGSLNAIQAPNVSMTKSMYVMNTGTADLTWDIFEANAPAALQEIMAPTAGIRRVFWDQPVNGSSGVTSDYFTDQGTGNYLADDFVPQKDTQLTEIFVQGFTDGASLSQATKLSWYLYLNSASNIPAGNPQTGAGTEFWKFTAPPNAPGVDITSNNIKLDLQAAGAPLPTLTAGTRYWLVVFPDIDSASVGRWFWLQGAPNDNVAQFWNGTGNDVFKQWLPTTFPLYDFGFTGLAFRLTGLEETVCDTPSNIPWITSISPASGLTAPDDDSLVSITVNTAGLSPGAYEATLCLSSNAPDEPLIELPVTLQVSTTCNAATAVALNAGGSLRFSVVGAYPCGRPLGQAQGQPLHHHTKH
jgi:hypothetical protein